MSLVLRYFNFDQLKRKNYSIIESATEYFFQKQFCEMNSTKRIILLHSLKLRECINKDNNLVNRCLSVACGKDNV